MGRGVLFMAAATISFLAALAGRAGAQSYDFKSLPDIPGAKGRIQELAITGINAAGDLVGYFVDDASTHGFIYSAQTGEYTVLDYPDPATTDTFANGLNSSDDVVGTYEARDGRRHGFLYRKGQYRSIDFGGALATETRGINSSGLIVGTFYTPTGSGGFLSPDGKVFSAMDPRVLEALGINDLADVVGVARTTPEGEGFLCSGQPAECTFGGLLGREARGINNAGDIIGRYGPELTAYVLSDGKRTPLYVRLSPGGASLAATLPLGINRIGEVVGSFEPPAGDARASGDGFIATPRINYRSIGPDTNRVSEGDDASARAGSTLVTFRTQLKGVSNPGDEIWIDAGEPTQEVLHVLTVLGIATAVRVQEPTRFAHLGSKYFLLHAYHTLQDWETARQGDLVGERRIEVGIAAQDLQPFTSDSRAVLTIDGSTSGPDAFMWLKSRAQFALEGLYPLIDGRRTTKYGIRVQDDYTRIEGLELVRFGGENGAAAVEVKNASHVRLSRLLIHDLKNGSFAVYGVTGNEDSDFVLRNSLVYDGDTAGVRTRMDTSRATVLNCTLYDMDFGVDEQRGRLSAVNTISVGSRRADFRITQGLQRANMSSDRTATGERSLVDEVPEFQFKDIPLKDFHIDVESNGRSAGVNLWHPSIAGIGAVPVINDFDTDPRPLRGKYDMGADQYRP